MATTNPSTEPAKAEKPKAVKGLRVIARTPGFRRAGRAFGVEPTDIPLTGLTNGQVEQLRAERELVVTDIVIKPTDETENAEQAPE